MRAIDVFHQGLEHVICAWQVDDVIVDPGPESTCDTLLDALGDEEPRALLLTHIHFDHAGAAGALVRQWPDLEVWVHERGARHLADPTRLVASAKRLYGDAFDRLWGEVVPIPQKNIRVLRGGESREGWDVAYTPGHASHHVSYRHADTGWVFAGDTAGVRLPPGDLLLAPTPPP
jgi:glyoxylase-like metal-dependent hydrolase (beta-lactamase superfamily II)